MAGQEKEGLFREKALKKISSPEELSEHLRVTNPSVWLILASVLLLLTGLIVWAGVTTIETTVDARVVFINGTGEVSASVELEAGQEIRIGSRIMDIDMLSTDSNGRIRALVFSDLPDGTYSAKVLVSAEHPLDFLLRR
ncbi:MAG: hypothetical protein II753_03130 [Spirochaetales bacterium]|nr:hypothetical protein [Spirochaetales bacterium]